MKKYIFGLIASLIFKEFISIDRDLNKMIKNIENSLDIFLKENPNIKELYEILNSDDHKNKSEDARNEVIDI